MWKTKISKLLGSFWTCVFGASKITEELVTFILSISCTYGMYIQNTILRFITGRIYKSKKTHKRILPTQVLLVADTYHQALGNDLTTDTTLGWVIKATEEISSPYMLQTTDSEASITFFRGIDYTYDNGSFYFFSDIAILNAVKESGKLITKADGSIALCYAFTGYTDTQTDYDAISGFYSKTLNKVADIAWDIHQNGATIYNIKKLLCGVSNSVVSDVSGKITDIGTDQGHNYAVINDEYVYISKDYPTTYTVNDDIQKGTVLFGDLVVYTGKDTTNLPLATEIPAVDIMTDAGLMRAENAQKTIVTANILPLSGSSEQLAKYEEVCKGIQSAGVYPTISVGAAGESINPYAFVMQRLRKNTGCSVATTVSDYNYLCAVLDFLNKNISTAGILNLYIKAYNDPTNIPIDVINTDACIVAVSDEATVNIQDVTTEGTTE